MRVGLPSLATRTSLRRPQCRSAITPRSDIPIICQKDVQPAVLRASAQTSLASFWGGQAAGGRRTPRCVRSSISYSSDLIWSRSSSVTVLATGFGASAALARVPLQQHAASRGSREEQMPGPQIGEYGALEI